MFKKIKELITQEEKLKDVLRRALVLEDYAKMLEETTEEQQDDIKQDQVVRGEWREIQTTSERINDYVNGSGKHLLKFNYNDRKEELEHYFDQGNQDIRKAVQVYSTEKENELMLFQEYYSLNASELNSALTMGYDGRAGTIMRHQALAGDMLWGSKEWVKWQIEQIEDIEIQKELKQYTYRVAMMVYFPMAEEFHIIQAGDYPGYIKFNYQLIEPEKYGYMVEGTAEERLEIAFNWMSDIKFEDGE